MSVIFDLDLTLVDSSIAEEARQGRNWPLVYSLIPQFTLYDGLKDVFDFIRNAGIEAAIVSTAPSIYVRKVIDHFSIPVHTVIGYHDAIRKPSPDGMLKAMNSLGAIPETTISFGDRAIDIIASRNARITSVACLWGTKERDALLGSSPDYTINDAKEILTLLQS